MPPVAALADTNQLTALLHALSPNQGVFLATAGLCLIFGEFNRPGRVLPGTTGLALFLLSAASLSRHALSPAALVLLAIATAVLALNLVRQVPLWLSALATVGVVLGLRFAVPGGTNPHVSLSVALTCGVTLGLLGTFLSRVAFRARRLKAVH